MRDFRFFYEPYFPLTFPRARSPDHRKVISKIEQAVLRGGLFAMAMPRGTGKTTICKSACIWAVLYGHREFVCLIVRHRRLVTTKATRWTAAGGLSFGAATLGSFTSSRTSHGAINRPCRLESIKMELDGNDLLLKDFPEVVYPIPCLDGIANRANGQLDKGERTHIGWTAREIVLPTIAGRQARGAIIKVASITGRIRGMKYKRADGRTVRPLRRL
ncbi:MAG TPA: hypothetical protein EYP14_11655 [Planctomycetaceae bacterium]|nr:hypothetical protein [Planctomycetaceae bacterium]